MGSGVETEKVNQLILKLKIYSYVHDINKGVVVFNFFLSISIIQFFIVEIVGFIGLN